MGLLERLKNKTSDIVGSGDKTANTAEENATISDIIEYEISGTRISRSAAEKISALSEGVSLIAETVASLPVYLYKKIDEENREKVKGDRRNALLNRENSEYSTSFNMKFNLVADYLYHGNGYLDIYRDLYGEIKSLIHIPYNEITLNEPYEVNKRNVKYSYNYWNMNTVPTFEVLNLARKPKDNQLKGYGILAEGHDTIGNSIELENYTKNTLINGFFAKAVIEKDGTITKKSRDSIKSMIKKFFSGSKNSGKVIILDEGMKLKTISLSPSDIGLLEQKEFSIKDIARLLKLQPSMLGVATGGMLYSNERDNQLVFLKNCISPLLTLIEHTFNKYLLTEEEKNQGYFFEFDTKALLRVSPVEEIKMYSEAVKGTIMLPNEARRKLNWKAVKGLERPIIGLSLGMISEKGEIISHLSNRTTNKNNTKGGD